MDNIKVSILIPAFNVEDYIDDCLRSLMNQTLEGIEVIVINDGSTDRTGDIAERYALLNSHIYVVHQEHQGGAETRNKCLALARGEYLGFVDGDGYVSADAFEQLYLRAESFSADIVLGSIMYSYDDGTSKRVGDKTAVFQSCMDVMEGKRCLKALMEIGSYIPMVCGNLYRTVFIRQYQLHFDSQLYEDESFFPYVLYFANRVIDMKLDFYHRRLEPIMYSDNLRLHAGALWLIAHKLKCFANEVIAISEDREFRDVFLQLAEILCNRAQNLYEKELSNSVKKCLFVITKESIAGKYGVGTYIQQLVQCFDITCWDINVVTLCAFKQIVQWKIKEGVGYYEIPLPEVMQYQRTESLEKYHNESAFYYLASRLISKRDIYCHFNFAAHYDLAMLFRQKLQAKIIFTLHYTDWSFDLLGDTSWLKCILANPKGTKDKRIFKQFMKEKNFMLDCCDYVIAIADHSYKMLEQLYGIPKELLVYIPNGIRDEYKTRGREERSKLRKKYGFGDNERIVLFAGRLDLVKGFVELIEAIKLVQREIPNVKLVVAGDGNYTLAFNTVAPCWSGVIFTGFISKEQLYELYAIADVGVVPSKHEEFGYVAVEMMMHELPVIVNNTTGLKEIVENGRYGIVFDYREGEGFRKLEEAIIHFLDKKNIDNQIVKRAREKVLEYYSLNSFRKKILDIYNRMENPYGISSIN